MEKMQGWGFLYLPSLLDHPYLVCIHFGVPSLHLFTFFSSSLSCIVDVENLLHVDYTLCTTNITAYQKIMVLGLFIHLLLKLVPWTFHVVSKRKVKCRHSSGIEHRVTGLKCHCSYHWTATKHINCGVSLITGMEYGIEWWNGKWNGTMNVHSYS